MPKQETPAPKSERMTVTIDLTDLPAVFKWITEEAENDERSRPVWVRRLVTSHFETAQEVANDK